MMAAVAASAVTAVVLGASFVESGLDWGLAALFAAAAGLVDLLRVGSREQSQGMARVGEAVTEGDQATQQTPLWSKQWPQRPAI